MRRKGVLYDAGRVMGANWRPDYSPALVRRELEIIRTGLHCNAVKICARDTGRLAAAAEEALRQGLEVWLCPELWNKPPDATLRHIARSAAAAGELRARWPGQVVLSVGTELTFFMRGIIKGRTYSSRTRGAATLREVIRSGAHNKPLNAFLARASAAVREVFSGPVSYASLPYERVDWDMFDVIGIDHYWREPVKDRYLQALEPLLASGKPVVITEFGFRTHTGADLGGPAAPANLDPVTMSLHMLPLTRRLVRPRVKTIHERNEELQARSLLRQLELLDSAGVDGAFVYTFTAPLWAHADDPEHDLDTDSYSLVKPCPGGRHGTTYTDMAWEPKKSFTAVADYYAGRPGQESANLTEKKRGTGSQPNWQAPSLSDRNLPALLRSDRNPR
jgi:hypothetical protein